MSSPSSTFEVKRSDRRFRLMVGSSQRSAGESDVNFRGGLMLQSITFLAKTKSHLFNRMFITELVNEHMHADGNPQININRPC